MQENRSDRVLAIFDRLKYFHSDTEPSVPDKKITIWNKYHDYRLLRTFNTIILTPKSTKLLSNDKSIIEKELLRCFEEGSHVCILCDSDSDKDEVITDVLLMVSSRIISFSNTISEINVKQSEFGEFLRSYGIVSNVFEINNPIESAICTMRYIFRNVDLQNKITKFQTEAIVGFSIKKDKGLLTLLPFRLKTDYQGEEIIKAVSELSKALDTHKKNTISQPPKWLNQVNTKKEEELQSQISKLQEEIKPKQALLDEQFKLKSILWLKGDKFVDKCIDVLNAIGVRTLKNDIKKEDFWILDNNQSEIVICECKGKDNNLTRDDINKLDNHKVARGKSINFPGLLIINNFNKANSILEKSIAISPNEIQHAVRMNILILRSLDLYHLLDLHQRNIVSTEEIISHFTSRNGWMKVTDNISFVLE